ncbi:hypothetical protein C1645_849677 [Glomus cerebriforme]|uniref:Ion transport domain-containing protein n=1 Tax=Glomus cerebriforme TaxID=658196 RepID=A0A397SVU7_9GLOM|nr:hypothetical protein C1645_849677 [Glomus cerebriforme]
MGEKVVETAIDIPPSETKDVTFDGIKKHKKHRESINRIFVSQYMDDEEYGSDDYIVTYSHEDESVLGWSVNIEKNGYQPDVYFKIDKLNEYNKKFFFSALRFIDLNSDRSSDRFLKLKRPVYDKGGTSFQNGYGINNNDAIGFLPNGDLVQVSVRDRKIYKYCFTSKPKNTDPWEYSQINDIKIPESLYSKFGLYCSIYRTKLFLVVSNRKMLQFDLLTMNLERQYHEFTDHWKPITVNKNQTLFATVLNNSTCIYSMENGMLILKHESGDSKDSKDSEDSEDDEDSEDGEDSESSKRVEFITLKNNSERLFIYGTRKLIDPYQDYDEIDVSDDFNNTSVITKLNRKIFVDNGNVCITNGIDEIDENKLQQLSNKRNGYYTLYTFKIIQSMLNEIIDQTEIKKVVPSYPEKIVLKDDVEIKNKGLCKVVLFNKDNWDYMTIEKNNENIGRGLHDNYHVLSFKLLKNQDVVLIDISGISIYTIDKDWFTCRYTWHNDEWNDIFKEFQKNHGINYDINFINKHYKPLIERILKNEFDDSKHSIPLPKSKYFRLFEDDMNDILISPKFGIEALKIVTEQKKDNYVRQIIESTQDYSENYMTIISLNLPKLCDYYPDFIIKYILCTSIMLTPYRKKIGDSKNTSLHSYTDIYIKRSNIDNTVFKSSSAVYKLLVRYLRPISAIYEWLIQHLRIDDEIQTVSFVVPFPQICVYQDDSKNNDHENNEAKKNYDIKSKITTILKEMITGLKIIMMIPKSNSIWNEFLYKPKSILFCNIDSNHFYNWWNFAAIIDYKWNTFGKHYYYLIWLFYTIFYICYSLASALERKSIPDFYFKLLFIISTVFGSIFLIFEIRQCLWNYKCYFKDIWNLFVLGYALAFFIVLRSNSINDDNDPRNVATKYDFVNPDGTISNNTTTIIQDPDSNTNLFNWFPTSLLAVYKLLTGDSGSLSSFTYREHSIMTILLVTFTFFTVIYLMNLFIGLLNLAIGDYNKKEEFLLQKAQIIMEIELFYMLPWQRNNKKWFPDWIYYDIPITEIRKLINAIDNEQTVFNYPPIISKELRKLVVLSDDVDNKLEKKIDQLTNQNVELKQQMERIINYIGVEQDNEEVQDNEKMQDNKEEQDNKLEMQKEQTKEELTRELKEKMNKMEQKMEEKMDKIEQKIESIMEALSKIK